jgi:ubiquitin-protein ligase
MDNAAVAVKIAEDPRWCITAGDSPGVYYVTFYAPKDCAYTGGTFVAELTFTNGYPMYPPRMRMLTKIFHPNFSQKKEHEGKTFIDILYDSYNMTITLWEILLYVWGLFARPDLSTTISNRDAAHLWRRDRQGFYKKARSWTELYAM